MVQVTPFPFRKSVLGYKVEIMKKSHLKGWKTPRTCCPQHARWVRQKPEQLDLFEGNWFYHERKLLYVQAQEDVPPPQPVPVQ